MQMLKARYEGFHQHMLVADGQATAFYRKCGFERAGKTPKRCGFMTAMTTVLNATPTNKRVPLNQTRMIDVNSP